MIAFMLSKINNENPSGPIQLEGFFVVHPYNLDKVTYIKKDSLKMAKIADRIKQLRKKKGISQSQLAEAIGVKNNTVST